MLPMIYVVVSEKERIVNLGKLTGKLTSGAGTLAGFREDKRNKATPGNILKFTAVTESQNIIPGFSH